MAGLKYRDNADINPSHYKNFGKETIDKIKERLSAEAFRGFCRGNVMKYVDRAGRKEGSTFERDVGKAAWYLQMEHHQFDSSVPDPREGVMTEFIGSVELMVAQRDC